MAVSRDDPDEFVYVIGHPEGYVKIGKSMDPEQRLGEIQCGSPYALSLVTTIGAFNDSSEYPIRTVEDGLHRYYRAGCVRREWYNISAQEVDALSQIDDLRASEIGVVVFGLHGLFQPSSGGAGKTLLGHLRDAWILLHDGGGL